MSLENLFLERDGAVAVFTINRPNVLNALHSSTLERLRRAVLYLRHDDAATTLCPARAAYFVGR